MKVVRVISSAMLCLVLGAYAQRDDQDEKRGKSEKGRGGDRKQQEQRVEQPRPQSQPEQRQQQRRQQERQIQQPQQRQVQQPPQRQQYGQWTQQQRQRTQQQARAWQQQRGWARQGAWQGQSSWRQGRARNWRTEHRTWTQRGGYGGYYIPQDRFFASFGSQHSFRIRSRPTIYMGFPRFQYGGFSFMMVDPWPEDWSENWYDTDDVYVDYDDGYYLYNRRHPGVGIALTVAL